MCKALGVGLALAGAAIAAVGFGSATPILIAGGAAVAFHAALVGLFGDGPAAIQPGAETFFQAPVHVTLSPSPSPAAAPDASQGGGSIVSNPDGTASPQGAGWSQNADGSYAHKNVAGQTDAGISADGYSGFVRSPDPGEGRIATGQGDWRWVRSADDGSVATARSTLINATNASGQQTTLAISEVQYYDNDGTLIQTDCNGGAGMGVSCVFVGNHDGTSAGINTSNINGYNPFGGTGGGSGSGSGSGTGSGTGTTTGTGKGGCTGDCALESTQQQINSQLKGIKDGLSGTGDGTDPESVSEAALGSAISASFGELDGLKTIGYAGGKTCPQIHFQWSVGGVAYDVKESSHCTLVQNQSRILSPVFYLLWLLLALFIVLSA